MRMTQKKKEAVTEQAAMLLDFAVRRLRAVGGPTRQELAEAISRAGEAVRKMGLLVACPEDE